MKIDLSKYLKNKDVQITNEDFDLDAMEKKSTKDTLKIVISKHLIIRVM